MLCFTMQNLCFAKICTNENITFYSITRNIQPTDCNMYTLNFTNMYVCAHPQVWDSTYALYVAVKSLVHMVQPLHACRKAKSIVYPYVDLKVLHNYSYILSH